MLFGFDTHIVLMSAIAACALMAAWKGGWPERVGGGVNLLIALSFHLAQRTLAGEALSMASLVIDGLLALSFLALAVRFARAWLGVAMLLQAAQFSLHAYYYVLERPHDLLFMAVNNLVSWGVLACIAGGVAATWWTRVRLQYAERTPRGLRTSGPAT